MLIGIIGVVVGLLAIFASKYMKAHQEKTKAQYEAQKLERKQKKEAKVAAKEAANNN